jgi:hypothetical protein
MEIKENSINQLIIVEIQEKGLNAEFLKAKELIANYAEKYKNLIFSDDEIKNAKKTNAELNASFTLIEDIRKKNKNEYLKPLEAFEEKIKELTNIIKEPINQIDEQIKKYENKFKEEKKEMIVEYFNSKNLFKDLIKIESIWNERWLNLTFTMKEAKDEIDAKLTVIASGLEAIESSIASDFKTEITDYFLRTLDLATALKKGKELEERKKKIDEYNIIQKEAKRKEDEARQKDEEERQRRQTERQETNKLQQISPEQSQLINKTTEEPIEKPTEEPQNIIIAEEIRKEITIKFCLTKSEMIKLNNYLKSNDITFHIENN